MDKIVEVTGGDGGNAFLILGREKAALLDCGMAYCADKLISNIKQRLNKLTLDYIFISHSHYDHIGAIPYLKQEWPNCKVFGAEHAKKILERPNALKAIRGLSNNAAIIYNSGDLQEYQDELLKVDIIIADGDITDLGGVTIKVIATPGHTQCSLAFLVNNETLFASETTGYMSESGKVYAAFITSSSAALASIHKCQELNPKFIISPHFGLLNKQATQDYWINCSLAIQETKNFIIDLSGQGYNEEQILAEYEKEFRDQTSKNQQPIDAFRLNVSNMIKVVRNENNDSQYRLT
ncbi:MAG: beta-lactamase domain protein [Firmicutes bacterium]|nr:beta-lactamase domain protein [Bacillota bacterium]